MRTRPIALCLCLSLSLLAGGCTRTWEPRYGPVAQTASAHTGGKVRLMMKDGSRPIDLDAVQVIGDSIVGQWGNPPQRLAVAADDVQLVLVSRVDTQSPVNNGLMAAGTVALVIVVGGLVALFMLIDKIPD